MVPSLALLRQIKDEWSKQRRIVYQYLCVCSENDIDKENADSLVAHTYEIDSRVTTDSAHILSFLSKPFEEKVIFSTYHSLSVVADAIKDLKFEFDFTFCDEAHKTAGVGSNKFSLIHNNNLIPSKYRLYSTATPRIVKESLKKKLGDDLNYAYDMNEPEVFGYEFYRMTFKEAIEQDILVDYKIVAIGVNNEELKEFISQRRFIDKNLSIDELANNYALEHVMQKYNANHGLTFHSRVKLAVEFSKRHQLLFKDTKTFSVSGEQSTNHRNTVLDQFKLSNKAIVSNARCLTEGVDVPTIDLVYFCDPKNSKVDIVQAVGRALRKKEGKKIGLIVVPIYHTNRDNVENSISEGSFKNLLQVIRSLCDQDERLQEEINDLAFGKGKRFSKKIDVLSSNIFDVHNKIVLEGFEDKLKQALYSQIIEKSSNNWDLWFLNFQDYLKGNNKKYPSKNQHQDLYNWIALQRNRKKNGILKNEEIRKLNSIDFVWNIIESKWERMFLQFQEYSKKEMFPPLGGVDDEELVSWYRYQVARIRENKGLSDDQKKRFISVDQKFEGPANRKKWFKPFDELLKFRQENSNKWPQYDKENPNSIESELSVFCQTIRKRFRQGTLENYWFDKLLSIGFNLAGHSDNWTEYFNIVKDLLKEKKSISISEIGGNAYSWIIRYKRKYDKGELSEYESKKIEELNLDRFFESWSTRFEEVKDWVNENKKLPTVKTHKEYCKWLSFQRVKHKSKRLTEQQIDLLASVGYRLDIVNDNNPNVRWLNYFNQLKDFIENNNRYPGPAKEKELYIWVQSQRAVQVGTLRNRKPLSKERVDLLNSINFLWTGTSIDNEQWQRNFDALKSHINSKGILELPSLENGKSKKIYTWFWNQKKAFKRGELSKDRVIAFERLGIQLSSVLNNPKKYLEIKWEKRIYELSNFIIENGHFPRSKSKSESNLYGFLIRTKKAYLEERLTKEQLALIEKLKLSFD